MKTKTKMSFENLTREEIDLIDEIATRACDIARLDVGVSIKKAEMFMDLVACHTVACPLNLYRFFVADRSNFAHDAFGIRRHINRETFQLEDCFIPRFAKWN